MFVSRSILNAESYRIHSDIFRNIVFLNFETFLIFFSSIDRESSTILKQFYDELTKCYLLNVRRENNVKKITLNRVYDPTIYDIDVSLDFFLGLCKFKVSQVLTVSWKIAHDQFYDLCAPQNYFLTLLIYLSLCSHEQN